MQRLIIQVKHRKNLTDLALKISLLLFIEMQLYLIYYDYYTLS